MLVSPLSSWNKISSQKTHFSLSHPAFSGYTLHVSKAIGAKPENSIVHLFAEGQESPIISMHALQCAREKAKLIVMAPDWMLTPNNPENKLRRVRRAGRAGTQIILPRKGSFKLLYTGTNQALQGAVVHVKALQTALRNIKLDVRARQALGIRRADTEWA